MTKSAHTKSPIKTDYVKYGFIAIFLLYCFDLLFNYISFDATRMFGYLDYQSHWQSQYDLVAGKILYRDFYWEYGLLTLFLRLPFFFILGKTFYSNFFNNFVFLPILAITISYFIAKQYLNKKAMIVFFFLMLLYRLNDDYNGIRHLIPELGLITAMIGVQTGNTRKKLIGSFLLGISLISSVEYALIANISYTLFFVFYTFFHEKKRIIQNFIQTFSFQLGIGALFLIYLVKNNILDKYISFHLQFVKAFYTNSPDRSVFPRFGNLGEIFQSNDGFLFNFFVMLQRLNIYFIVVIIGFLLAWNIYNRKSKWFLLNLTLIVYAIFAYTRTLNTPGYIHYGLTFILMMVSSIPFLENISKRAKIATIIIIIWLCVASGFQYTLKRISDFNEKSKLSTQKEFLPIAGMSLDKTIVEEYKKITEYIVKNTTPDDYVYVYPDGPYNQLTNRKSPTAAYSTVYYGLVPTLVDSTYQELARNKPKYVVINKYNSSSFISAISGVGYNVLSEGNNVYIIGLTTKVEDYIQQNYDVDTKFKLAWVLKRRDTEKPLKHIFVPIKDKKWGIRFNKLEQSGMSLSDTINLSVQENDFEMYYIPDSFEGINLVKVPIFVNLGMIKSFSKFSYDVFLITNDGKAYGVKRNFISSDWQNVYIDIPNVEAPITIKALMIKVPGNMGFLMFGKPQSVQLKSPTAYTINKEIKIEDSIIKN